MENVMLGVDEATTIKPNHDSNGRKRGKLSNEEMSYICMHYVNERPEEIGRTLNRSPSPIYKYLRNTIPDWEEDIRYEDDLSNVTFNKRVFELMSSGDMSQAKAQSLLKTNGVSGARSKEQLKVEHFKKFMEHFEDFKECVEGLSSSIKILTNYVEANVLSWQEDIMDGMSKEITDERRELDIQKAMHKSELMTKCNMSLPPSPTYTRHELPLTLARNVSAIYFGWDNGEVVYVGKTIDLRIRLSGHHKIGEYEPVSYIECPSHLLSQNECFYIWSLSPSRNSEVINDSECIGTSSNLTEEE